MSPGPYLNIGVFQTKITDNDLVGPKEELGSWRYEGAKVVRYVKSGSLVPQYEGLKLDATVTTAALMGNQVLQCDGLTNMFFGVADNATFANLSFGWVTMYGPATARVATTTIPESSLGPSANTGVLSIRSTCHFNAVAVALQTGISAGSAVFVTVL